MSKFQEVNRIYFTAVQKKKGIDVEGYSGVNSFRITLLHPADILHENNYSETNQPGLFLHHHSLVLRSYGSGH